MAIHIKFRRLIVILLTICGIASIGFLSWIVFSDSSVTAGDVDIVLKFVNFICALLLASIVIAVIIFSARIMYMGLKLVAKEIHSKIISIGIVSLLYYKAIQAIVVFPFIFLISNTADVLYNSIGKDVWQTSNAEITQDYSSYSSFNGSTQSDGTNLYDLGYDDGFKDGQDVGNKANPEVYPFFSNLIAIFNYYLNQLFTLLYKFFDTLLIGQDRDNFKHITLGILVIYLIGAVCDNISTGANNQYLPTFRKWIYEYRQNLLFTAIFLIGGFLGMSSIIAIPIFEQGSTIQTVSGEDFKKRMEKEMEGYTLKPDTTVEIRTASLEGVRRDLNKLKAAIDSISNVAEKDTSVRKLADRTKWTISEIANLTQNINRTVGDYKSQETIKNKLTTYKTELEKERRQVEMAYQNILNDIAIGNERSNFHDRCIVYFNNFANGYKASLTSHLDLLKRTLAFNDTQLEELRQKIGEFRQYLRNPGSTYPPMLDDGIYFREFPEWQYENYEQFPVFRDDGSHDLFGRIASWLVATRNKEMILISGMLGFGLLGAGISSLIRDRDSEGKNPLFKNKVSSTLIGGVSASLVIFLSAKGGTAIFTNDKIDLNMYTLLFVCLLGAVFSESIWEKAYRYINGQDPLPPAGGSTGEHGNNPKPAPSGAPADPIESIAVEKTV